MGRKILSVPSQILSEALKEQGLDVKGAAVKLGVTEASVRHWLNGTREIKPSRFEGISHDLGYDRNIFFDQGPHSTVKESCKPVKPNASLLNKAEEVLDSGTHYAISLTMNIESFYAALSREKAWESRFAALEQSFEWLRLRPPGDTPPFQGGAEEPGASPRKTRMKSPKKLI